MATTAQKAIPKISRIVVANPTSRMDGWPLRKMTDHESDFVMTVYGEKRANSGTYCRRSEISVATTAARNTTEEAQKHSSERHEIGLPTRCYLIPL